jgi:hypothetical protein
MTRTCSKCRRDLPLGEFTTNRGRKDGLQLSCKQCLRECLRVARNTPDGKAKMKTWREKHRVQLRYNTIKCEFGLSRAGFDSLFDSQDGKCKICRREIERPPGFDNRKAAHIDHDHATGRVRGLLCCTCNVGIGNFQDSPLLLERAKRYVGGTL